MSSPVTASPQYEDPACCHRPCSSLPSDASFNHWDLIPDALVAKILALLPFSSIYLGRGVCQRWRAIIWSPLFTSFCRMGPPRMPWLLEFQQHMYNQSWAYDLEGRQWFHVDFFFLPEDAIILATSGGLVCLGTQTQDGYGMYLCNPLTKDWKKLPCIGCQPDVVVMEVDRKTGAYKVVVLLIRRPAGVGYSGSIFVFDGKAGNWRETTHVPENLCAGNLRDAAVSGGVLYCLSTNQRLDAFDLDRRFWTPARYPTEAMARILSLQRLSQRQEDEDSVLGDAYLCDRKGRLAMVAPHRNFKHMYINKFDAATRTWRSCHVSAVPGSIICVGPFSSMAVSSTPPHRQSHVYLIHSKGSGHYDAAGKSFEYLPRSPLTRHKLEGGEIMVKGLWYEPRMDARI